jgi:hypothetical protein
MPLARLCQYYLDCLSHEDLGGVSLPAQAPPLHPALWQSRSEPVNALRCASMNARKNARH